MKTCSCVHRERPWGWYETYETGPNFKLKKIFVKPNERFSLQYHNDRQEHWIILDGSGTVQLNEYTEFVLPGKHFMIPMGSRHRMTAGEDGITFYEVQQGPRVSEDDIVRLEDDYGRIDMKEYYTD